MLEGGRELCQRIAGSPSLYRVRPSGVTTHRASGNRSLTANSVDPKPSLHLTIPLERGPMLASSSSARGLSIHSFNFLSRNKKVPHMNPLTHMGLASNILQVSGILAGISTSFTVSRVREERGGEVRGILVVDSGTLKSLRSYLTFKRFIFSTLSFIFSTLLSLLWIFSVVMELELLASLAAVATTALLVLGLTIFISIVADFLRYELWA